MIDFVAVSSDSGSAGWSHLRSRRSNVFFVLDVEQWTSSTPSAGSSRARGSLRNQFTYVLWIWRRRSAASLRGSCEGFSGIVGCGAPFMQAVCSLYDWSPNLVRITGSMLDLFPVRVGLRQGCLLSPILFLTLMD